MLFILIHGARIKRKTCEVVSDLRQLFVLHVVRVRAHAFPGTLPYVTRLYFVHGRQLWLVHVFENCSLYKIV